MIREKLKQLRNIDPTKVQKKVEKKLKELKNITPEHVEEHLTKFQIEVRKYMATAISTAFALVIALVWKDAIQAFVDNIIADLKLTQEVHYYRLIVAILVTIICVFGILFISRWSEKEAKKEEEEKEKK